MPYCGTKEVSQILIFLLFSLTRTFFLFVPIWAQIGRNDNMDYLSSELVNLGVSPIPQYLSKNL